MSHYWRLASLNVNHDRFCFPTRVILLILLIACFKTEWAQFACREKDELMGWCRDFILNWPSLVVVFKKENKKGFRFTLSHIDVPRQ